jgi:hypothetical protein
VKHLLDQKSMMMGPRGKLNEGGGHKKKKHDIHLSDVVGAHLTEKKKTRVGVHN